MQPLSQELLPVELVRAFFETAAEDKETAVALARVSKAVNNWITPILYHTVILDNADSTQSLYDTLTTTMGSSVRRLALIWWKPYIDLDPLYCFRSIVRRCPQLETVALEFRALDDEIYAEVDTSKWPEVSNIVIYSVLNFQPGLWGVTWSILWHPLIQNVTHLHHHEFMVDELLLLPRLTHFGYHSRVVEVEDHGPDFCRDIRRFLSESATLILTLFRLPIPEEVLADSHLRRDLAQIDDVRLLVDVAPSQEPLEEYCINKFCSMDTGWDDAAVKYRGWRMTS